jgi:hypothetical protein
MKLGHSESPFVNSVRSTLHRFFGEDPTQQSGTECRRTSHQKISFRGRTNLLYDSLELDLLDVIEIDEDDEDDRVIQLLEVSQELDDHAESDDEY